MTPVACFQVSWGSSLCFIHVFVLSIEFVYPLHCTHVNPESSNSHAFTFAMHAWPTPTSWASWWTKGVPVKTHPGGYFHSLGAASTSLPSLSRNLNDAVSLSSSIVSAWVRCANQPQYLARCWSIRDGLACHSSVKPTTWSPHEGQLEWYQDRPTKWRWPIQCFQRMMQSPQTERRALNVPDTQRWLLSLGFGLRWLLEIILLWLYVIWLRWPLGVRLSPRDFPVLGMGLPPAPSGGLPIAYPTFVLCRLEFVEQDPVLDLPMQALWMCCSSLPARQT